MTEDDLRRWSTEIENTKSARSELLNDTDIKQFENWIKRQQLKIAPGFSFDSVMKPSKAEIQDDDSTHDTEVNELDKVFGKTTI